MAAVLPTADPKLKADVYAGLGIDITYDHDKRLVVVSAQPYGTERVGEGVGEGLQNQDISTGCVKT